MNSSVLHRRRIERYAQLLDEASGARRHHSRSPIDDELNDLVSIGNLLTEATPEVTVRPEWRSETRAFLLATAEREGIGKTAVAETAIGRATVAPARASSVVRSGTKILLPKTSAPKAQLTTRRGRARGAILVGLAVGTLALSGISAASGDAMPGDALYGMKRSAENAQIALAGSDVSKGGLYLDFARTRLGEAEAVHTDAKMLASVLKDMDNQTTLGVRLLFNDALKHHSEADLRTVNQFLIDQNTEIVDLRAEVSSDASEAVVSKSVGLLDGIGLRLASVQKALDCGSWSIETTTSIGQLPICQESAPVTPDGSSSQPTGRGKSSKSGTHESATTTPDSAAAPTPVQPSAPAARTASQPAPSTAPSNDGGLLGAVEHLLGGL